MIIETVEDLIEALAKLDPKMKVRVDYPKGLGGTSEIDSVETDNAIGKVVIKV